MPARDVIVMGASAGGIEAITAVLRTLPPDLPAAIFVVVHIPPTATSVLPNIVNRLDTIPALHPQRSQKVQPGKVYIAPPGFHMGLNNGEVFLSRGPRENGARPAVDFLFRSAAKAFGNRVIGVVLSGMLYDGTAGLRAIHESGGLTIVQQPADALFDSMPVSAIRAIEVDYILPAAEIGALLKTLVYQASPAPQPAPGGKGEMKHQAEDEVDQDSKGKKLTRLTCPDCGGVLEEIENEHEILDYECQVGHRYNQKSLMMQQSEQLEHAMWDAVRLLRERANLIRRMSRQAKEAGRPISASRLLRTAEQAEKNSAVLSGFIESSLFAGEQPTEQAEGDDGAGE